MRKRNKLIKRHKPKSFTSDFCLYFKQMESLFLKKMTSDKRKICDLILNKNKTNKYIKKKSYVQGKLYSKD